MDGLTYVMTKAEGWRTQTGGRTMRIALIGLLMFATTGCGSKEYKWQIVMGAGDDAFRMNKETGQTWFCEGDTCRLVREFSTVYDHQDVLPLTQPPKAKE